MFQYLALLAFAISAVAGGAIPASRTSIVGPSGAIVEDHGVAPVPIVRTPVLLETKTVKHEIPLAPLPTKIVETPVVIEAKGIPFGHPISAAVLPAKIVETPLVVEAKSVPVHHEVSFVAEHPVYVHHPAVFKSYVPAPIYYGKAIAPFPRHYFGKK